MVRLEDHAPADAVLRFMGFNSSLVRLEVRRPVRAFPSVSSFQFQLGSIRRFVQRGCQTGPVGGFNSSLVRLEGTGNANITLGLSLFQFQLGSIRRRTGTEKRGQFRKSFNSSLVRLEANPQPAPRRETPRFNSSLVRLEGFCRVSDCIRRILFQFQLGSIRSIINHLSVQARLFVSIPAWFD